MISLQFGRYSIPQLICIKFRIDRNTKFFFFDKMQKNEGIPKIWTPKLQVAMAYKIFFKNVIFLRFQGYGIIRLKFFS